MKFTNEYREAIHRLAPTSAWAFADDKIIWRDDSVKEPTDKEIKAEIARYDKEFADNKYQRDRQAEYGGIGDQLDLLFHDMTAGKGTKDGEWYKAIAKIKSDNPKE